MAIPDRDIIDVTPKRTNRAEALFVPAVFKGLGTTLRHCLQNVGRDGKQKKNRDEAAQENELLQRISPQQFFCKEVEHQPAQDAEH